MSKAFSAPFHRLDLIPYRRPGQRPASVSRCVTVRHQTLRRAPPGRIGNDSSRKPGIRSNLRAGETLITGIADGHLSWRRDQEKIDAEAELDGIYVIRTSAAEEKLGTGETVEAYKDLGNLERDFWSMKAEDIGLRPIYHYLENRVRAHVFLCMLATYLTWHLRQALARPSPRSLSPTTISPPAKTR